MSTPIDQLPDAWVQGSQTSTGAASLGPWSVSIVYGQTQDGSGRVKVLANGQVGFRAGGEPNKPVQLGVVDLRGLDSPREARRIGQALQRNISALARLARNAGREAFTKGVTAPPAGILAEKVPDAPGFVVRRFRQVLEAEAPDPREPTLDVLAETLRRETPLEVLPDPNVDTRPNTAASGGSAVPPVVDLRGGATGNATKDARSTDNAGLIAPEPNPVDTGAGERGAQTSGPAERAERAASEAAAREDLRLKGRGVESADAAASASKSEDGVSTGLGGPALAVGGLIALGVLLNR